MRAEFRRNLESSISIALKSYAVSAEASTSTTSKLSITVSAGKFRKRLMFSDRDALVTCEIAPLEEDEGEGPSWGVDFEPSFAVMKQVSEANPDTAMVREKTSRLYWRFSGSMRAQVPVHNPAQERAYLEMTLPELIPFVLKHLNRPS